MPFENTGGDADIQFPCDGIAESLINWLATVSDIKVISKSAAFRMREYANDTAQGTSPAAEFPGDRYLIPRPTDTRVLGLISRRL